MEKYEQVTATGNHQCGSEDYMNDPMQHNYMKKTQGDTRPEKPTEQNDG
jgi:hypothetical protein